MKLFLIDGHALVFKMYYAFLGRPMVNSKGVDTSIIFGFTKYLLELIRRERPTHLAVSFDLPGGTFRNVMFPDYKANRPPTPQLVIDALEPLCNIVTSLDIPVVTARGFEADDVIGTIAKRFGAADMDVYMVTPDKDYGQLVGEHIFQYKPGHKNNENDILGIPEICDKWCIDSTLQVIDMLAICGDTADNVPGVKGVGQVGASKMIRKFGSLEAIYEHLGELAPRQRQMFEDARDHIGLSKTLVTIKTDVPVEVSLDDMAVRGVLTPAAESLIDLYEMPSLKRLLAPSDSPAPSGSPADRTEGPVPAAVSADAGAGVAGENRAALGNVRGGTGAERTVGSSDSETFSPASPCAAPENLVPIMMVGTKLYGAERDVLEDEKVAKCGFGMKEIIKHLSQDGVQLNGKLYDVELMHYLLNPESSHKFEDLSLQYLGLDLGSGSASHSDAGLFDEAPDNDADIPSRLDAVLKLSTLFYGRMSAEPAIIELYNNIEEPLIGVLARMENAGVRVDISSLQEFALSLRTEMLRQEAIVRETAQMPSLNVSSPKQIGELVFERLKLDPTAKKPKNGNWPTDETTLQELADRSPIIDAILEYRGLRKLLNTYIEPFPTYISPRDGRVHTTFNQALTSTGRLSSSNPNLQNIPIRTELGRNIRRAFVPSDSDSVIMSADYSQIELRIMAHLCGDEHLRAAFRAGEDVHSATASKIFGVPAGEVSAEQRRMAKTANFGIMYGISSFGLSQRLKCSRAEAKQLIDGYFASFPSIRGFIDSTLAAARRDGYVQTLFGRRRYVPDVNSHNGNIRALAERNAVNAPIQGTAADIIKLAMIAVDRELRAAGLKARMVLQIHDELVLEVPLAEVSRVHDILVDKMEGVMELSVPLTVECNYGKNWLEAH